MCARSMSGRTLICNAETYIIVLLSPIRQARKGLDYFDPLPPLSERTDGQFMCEVKTFLIKTWLKEFTAGSDERGKQKRTLRAHIID
jgi:hypothetical protein